MVQPHLRKQLLFLTIPIFIETLLVMLLGFVDVIMLSQISDAVVASVGLVNQLLITVYMVFMIGSVGASVLCSQYFGARQQENFTQSVGVTLLFNLFLGVLVSLFFYFYTDEILQLIDVNPDMLESATVYAFIVGSFVIFPSLGMALATVLRSCNLTRLPMYVSIFVNISNIIGNYALIFGKFGFPAMGVEGAAISTVCSRFVAVILLGYLVWRYALKLPLFPQLFPFPWDKLKKMLFIGLPSAGEMVSYSLSQMVIMYFINQLGSDAVAARTYAMNFIMFIFLFAMSLGQGTSIAIGQLIGKNQNQAAYLLGRFSARLAIFVSVSLSLGLALIAPFLMPLVTNNAHIIATCLTIFWIDIALEVGRSVNIVLGRALSSVGNPQFPFIVGIIFMWGFATLGAYVFGVWFGFGLIGMWVAFFADETARALAMWIRWLSKKWQNRGFVEKMSG